MTYVVVLCANLDPEPEDNVKVMSPKGRTYWVNEEGARILLSKGWSIVLDSAPEPTVTDEIPFWGGRG